MSMTIPDAVFGAAWSYGAAGVKEPPQVQRAEADIPVQSRAPVVDEYIPEKRTAGDKAERCTGSTDRVDREIERLRRRKEALERQIGSQTDGVKIRELERELDRTERELAQKDNDAYRRRHTVFS